MSKSVDNTLRVWVEANERARRVKLKGLKQSVFVAAWTPNETRVISGSNPKFRYFCCETNQSGESVAVNRYEKWVSAAVATLDVSLVVSVSCK